jgi:hypothetical protein
MSHNFTVARRVRLVVMLAFWENRQFMEVFGEPWGGFRNVNEAVLDQRGLRVQAQDLLGGRLVTGDTIAAIGD